MSDIKLFLTQLSYLIFPRRCFFCGAVIAPHADACRKCGESVERVRPPVCLFCGCGKDRCTCKKHRRFYSAAAAPFYYSGPVRNCLFRFKFSGRKELAAELGGEMAQTVKNAFGHMSFDLVTCVPMRRVNEKIRGFNQSALLCKEVAKQLGVACDSSTLVKLYDTSNQHDLPVYRRSGNIFGVFDVAVPEKVMDRTILLCDDIKTSGETLNECAKMLILSGAKEVACVCAAVVCKRKTDDE